MIALLLLGCADPRDGTYLFTLRLVEDTCDGANPDVGVETEQMGAVWRTTASLAVDLGRVSLQAGPEPLLLAGVDRGGDAFLATQETSTAWDSESCSTDDLTRTVELSGTFAPDGGIEAWLSDSTRRRLECGSDTDVDETCAWNYAVTALRLDVGDAHHEDLAWGNLPGRAGP